MKVRKLTFKEHITIYWILDIWIVSFIWIMVRSFRGDYDLWGVPVGEAVLYGAVTLMVFALTLAKRARFEKNRKS